MKIKKISKITERDRNWWSSGHWFDDDLKMEARNDFEKMAMLANKQRQMAQTINEIISCLNKKNKE